MKVPIIMPEGRTDRQICLFVGYAEDSGKSRLSGKVGGA